MFYLQMLSKIFSEGEGLGGEDPEYFDPRLHQGKPPPPLLAILIRTWFIYAFLGHFCIMCMVFIFMLYLLAS